MRLRISRGGLRGGSPLRSFALGGLVGAAGAVATLRRLRRVSRENRAAGLAAFEGAPCFVELTGSEPDQVREGAGSEDRKEV
jgi:hypothetical protein